MSGRRDERRRRGRIEILGELHGEVTLVQATVIREIGLDGARIETAFPLQPNSLHDFRLRLGDRTIVVKGRVAHCRIDDVDQERVTYASGVEFVEPQERVLGVLDGFLDEIEAGRRARS